MVSLERTLIRAALASMLLFSWFSAGAAEEARLGAGDVVRMPDWGSWRGPMLTAGQPGAIFLLAPADRLPTEPAAMAVARQLSEWSKRHNR